MTGTNAGDLLAGVGAAILSAVSASPSFSKRWKSPAARNHRGSIVPVTLGVSLMSSLILVLVAASVGNSIAGRPIVPDLWLIPPVALVFAAGFADDLQPSRIHGLRAHARMLLHGRVTTGIWKLIAAVAAAAIWTFATHASASRTLLGIPVIAGATNLFNLLDVRPGRALKYGALAGLVLSIGHLSTVSAAIVGACLGLLPFDLSERGMLGDGGSNVLGFAIGVVLFDRLSTAGLAFALVVILVLHALAETVTLSRIIDAVAPLRWFDRLGRLPDPSGRDQMPSSPEA